MRACAALQNTTAARAGRDPGRTRGDGAGSRVELGCWPPASLSGTMRQVTDRVTVSSWVAAYEDAWRAPGTAGRAEIYTHDAGYLHTPYEEPVEGPDVIRRMRDAGRDSPDEVFTLATSILAVDGDTAVVRAEVRYGIRSARSTATRGSSGSMTTAAVAGSRNGPTGPDAPTPPATTTEHAFRSCRVGARRAASAE